MFKRLVIVGFCSAMALANSFLEPYTSNTHLKEAADKVLSAGKLPNIEWFGRGYDIYKGNPRESGAYDPGFAPDPLF